ncbi:MAG: glycosyltransferase [Luteitalea sp.]|nr:glycosyltransferase [Luteitalea sp.]
MRNVIDLDRDGTSAVFIAGMGRSGTTWVANIVNYDNGYRDVFEPFLPAEVPEAQIFGYHEYRRAHERLPAKEEVVRRILSGRIGCPWTDKFNRRLISWRRIVKDIRCNLMLGWLRQVRPGMPIILVARHPLGVIRSWLKLGWGTALGGGTDVDHILSQRPLLEDFPKVDELLSAIDRTDTFESTAFLWCVLNMVPLVQLQDSRALIVRYEDLLRDPTVWIAKIFQHVGRPYDHKAVARTMRLGSGTNFLGRHMATISIDAVAQEMNTFSAQQVAKLASLVRRAGLDDLYGDEFYGDAWSKAPTSAKTRGRESRIANAPEMMMSVVVCTRNRVERLQRCLDAFGNLQSIHPWELIVVDNGSTDETPEVIERFKQGAPFPVHSVFEGHPGLGRARNTGWHAASGAIIAFTDDDCYPAPDYVSQVVACFDERRVAFLGGRIRLYDPADYPITIRTVESRLEIRPYSFVPAGAIQGANFAFRREALAAVGGFDAEMGAGTPFPCEDVEILARLSFAGFAGMYDPRPLVYHHHGRRESDAAELGRGYDRGRGAYFAKCLLDRRMRRRYLKGWYWGIKKHSVGRTVREGVGAMNYLSGRLRFRHR